jgi:YVTN family beta-propeller protein
VVIATITAGDGATYAAFTADGTTVYVANRNSDNVTVIDTATNTVITTITAGDFPQFVVALDNTSIYVANSFSDELSVIDVATNTVVTTLTLGDFPRYMALSPDQAKLYVANVGSMNVSVIDTATNIILATVTVGTSPSPMAITPDNARVYVPNTTTDDVSVIDATTNLVTTTITAGDGPIFAAITFDGTRVYVANRSEGTVTVIDVGTNTVIATVTVGGLAQYIVTPFAPPAPPTFSLVASAKKARAYGMRFKYYALTWNAFPGATVYKIFRNGILLSQHTHSTHFEDTAIDPNVAYTYDVVAYADDVQIGSAQVHIGPS